MAIRRRITTRRQRQQRTGPQPFLYRIDEATYVDGLARIEARIEELGLDTTSPRVPIRGSTRDGSMGTHTARQTSIDRYEVVWNGFLNFCIQIGDYESGMLVHRERCPANPYAVNFQTAVLYLNFRHLEAGTPLVNPFDENEAVVKDVHGREMICRGDWHAKSTVVLFATALSLLHRTYRRTTGPYQEECTACNEALREAATGTTPSCAQHPGSPQYYPVGNLAEHRPFRDRIKMASLYVQARHKARRTLALLPGELRQIRAALLSRNSLFDCMTWVLIITGCKLFTRVEETLDMTVEKFVADYFVVIDDHIQALATEIQGKTDPEIYTLLLWDDEKCPEFSAVRAILLWLAISGIKSGKIFPSLDLFAEDRSSLTTDSPTTSLSYKMVLACVRELCVDVLKMATDDRTIIGTHMLKKTAFLLAVWSLIEHRKRVKGGAIDTDELGSLQYSGRHKNADTTIGYIHDSGVLKVLYDRIEPGSTRHMVGDWHSIRTAENPTFLRFARSRGSGRSVVELADWYTFEKLSVPRNWQALGFSIADLFAKSSEYVRDPTLDEKLVAAMERIVPNEHERNELRALVQEKLTQHARAVMNPAVLVPPAPAGGMAAGPSGSGGTMPAPLPAPAAPGGSAKRRWDVVPERDYQEEARECGPNKKAKLEVYLACAADVEAQLSKGKVISAKDAGGRQLRAFAFRCRRVADCLNECYRQSTDEFLDAVETRNTSLSGWKCPNSRRHGTGRPRHSR